MSRSCGSGAGGERPPPTRKRRAARQLASLYAPRGTAARARVPSFWPCGCRRRWPLKFRSQLFMMHAQISRHPPRAKKWCAPVSLLHSHSHSHTLASAANERLPRLPRPPPREVGKAKLSPRRGGGSASSEGAHLKHSRTQHARTGAGKVDNFIWVRPLGQAPEQRTARARAGRTSGEAQQLDWKRPSAGARNQAAVAPRTR